MVEQEGYYEDPMQEVGFRIKDLEEKERLNKERILLISNNLVEFKQKTREEITNLKKDIDIIKENIKRMSSFLETISDELPKFARKEQVDILARQAKMFQPLKK